MKLWLTSSEIAELALPGLPTSRKNVLALAEREDWARFTSLCRQRDGRGGGVEYHVSLLPAMARAEYFVRVGGAQLEQAAALALQAAPDLAIAGQAAGEQLDARIAILGALRAFQRTAELQQTVAIALFVDLYNLGRADVPAWVRERVRRLSTRTLLRWITASREGETQRLAVDRGASRRGKGVLEAGADGQLKAFILALVAQNPLYTARQIHEACLGRFPQGVALEGEMRTLPGQRAFEIALKRWKSELQTELLALTNPDAFVSKTRIAGSYTHLTTALNELWQIDASPVDALCLDGRHSVYACIDIFSRRLILHVSKTPRSEAVQLLMRKALVAWGVPDKVKTDNGSDFVAKATRRLFAALQIEHITSAAFSPWQKGPVERVIRTFQTDLGRTLPGFIGHSVSDRKVIEARRAFAARLGTDDAKAFAVELTGEQLQAECDAWAEGQYGRRDHGALGMSPFAKAASWTQPVRRVDAEALTVLLMPAPGGDGIRTLGKRGVRIDGFHYLVAGVSVGTRVFVRLDPADKGRVWCHDPETDALLGEGRCPELLGEDPAAIRAEVAAEQKRLIDERTAAMRAERRNITSRTVLDLRRQRAAELSGNLVAFPQRAEQHSTPSLEAGAEIAALRRGEAPRPAPQTPEQLRLQAEIEADLAGTPLPPVVTPLRREETPAQRFRRAQAIEAQLATGEVVANADALWLGGYQASAEYRAQKTIAEDFGEAALR